MTVVTIGYVDVDTIIETNEVVNNSTAMTTRLHLSPILLSLTRTAAAGTIDLGDGFPVLVHHFAAVDLFFENGLGVDGLELRSEVGEALCAAVRTAAGIIEGVTIVMDFFAITAPE